MRFANFLVSMGEIELMSIDGLALGEAFRDAVGAEQHFFDIRRVGHHDDNDVGFLRDFLCARACHAAGRRQFRCARRCAKSRNNW